MFSTLFARRWLSLAALALGLIPVGGCAGGRSWFWNPFTDQAYKQELKEDFEVITGRSGYTGLSSKSRDVERSLNSHF
jgi:hypothetical protein